MCKGSKSKHNPENFSMEGESLKQKDGTLFNCSVLLELAASDDLAAFKEEVEVKGFGVEEASLWYGRRVGSKKMGFEERTPLMIAAMFGSIDVLKYLIGTGMVDINRACGSDRVTALHCAIAGGADVSVEIVKFLLDASANPNHVDANGNKPCDLVTPTFKSIRSSTKRALEMLLKGEHFNQDSEEKLTTMPQLLKEGSDKKEYPIDVSLPDINNGLYGTDEFRMYSFKVKPCSRAYSHDWTECPFVHPGENARRRDPKKYPYTCVPCPDFRKGACQKGDACEYAHGVFESWLHPAQYRTRLCKDETGCNRKVCFFAHQPEELRPVYASTGSAMPSPRSASVSAVDMTTLSPLALGSASFPSPIVSTPPMSSLAAASPSPKSGGLRQNKINLTPPALQLSGSRLKSSLSARDLNFQMELLALENHNSLLQQQQLIDEISTLSSPSSWSKDFNRFGELKATNLEDVFGSIDPSVMSSLPGLPLQTSRPSTPTQVQSPTGLQMRQNMNQLRASYPATNLSSHSGWKPPSLGFDSSAAVAAAVMNSRSSSFAKRSQSFIDRGAVTNRLGVTAAANSVSMMPSNNISDWSSPDGKLDWGMQGDELNKLKKSASFGFRTRNASTTAAAAADFRPSHVGEPDVSWVTSLVKDVTPEKQQYNMGDGVRDSLPPWMEQMYREQEQMVA
ncbi:zinc finger CCCH domain-containing protein 29 [Tripterygium wilfordii]|uniref:Zinc finger CCCH domain-containing protein 29 n=1 Tax=Tripterygium wilfordii TaxID=458696 RepID=A0A7J7CWX7_TRIWF|nr:zinc finger CCCH domain-containing protein 29-like [Tripterygium wilfordii]KAF5738449.1 zinc finger CCCH domain-containing protein 29 [Tripterygium wilfordii]